MQRHTPATAAPPSSILVERTASQLYVTLSRFINFIEMNREGFRKTLKKHDKVCTASASACTQCEM